MSDNKETRKIRLFLISSLKVSVLFIRYHIYLLLLCVPVRLYWCVEARGASLHSNTASILCFYFIFAAFCTHNDGRNEFFLHLLDVVVALAPLCVRAAENNEKKTRKTQEKLKKNVDARVVDRMRSKFFDFLRFFLGISILNGEKAILRGWEGDFWAMEEPAE